MVTNSPASVCRAAETRPVSHVLDSVAFGVAASEAAHSTVAELSDIVTGGVGQPARRLLPHEPVTWQGGSLTFSLKVDPSSANYVTFKLWGSDASAVASRLLLSSNGLAIGYRDQGDYDIVNQVEAMPLYPGRFVYVTLPLPPSLTNGKTTLSITLSAIGPIYPYGGSFEQRQKPFSAPSRGVYAAYSSTSAYFELPASERQGGAPVYAVRPSPGPETMDKVRNRVNTFALKLTGQPVKQEMATPKEISGVPVFLATAYETPWCSVYHDGKTLQKIVQVGDAFAIAQSRDSNFVGSDWCGAGPLGWALLRVYPALDASGALAENIALPSGKSVPRRQAWADTLRASVDYWRDHRRFYTNQSMIVDQYIYTANEGLRLLDPSRARPKDEVLAYLYQATGIQPWLGSETSERSGGGGDLPEGGFTATPYGRNYSLMTEKGLGRELGFVSGYGETVLHFGSDIYRLTGDEKLRAQLIKMAHARAPFRYPLADHDGYKAMVLEAITDNRNGHYPGDVAYGAHHGSRESEPMEVAALTKDPQIVGVAQQELADNQYFSYLTSHLTVGDPFQVYGLLTAVDDYDIVSKLPASTYRLPMTDGQPDYVWADEGDAVVAVKHGDRRMYFNFYYRAERAINGLVRIHDMTATAERIVTARSQFEYTPSGSEYTRPDWVDGIRGTGFPPPGTTLHQAWAGEKMPIQKRPADAILPKYGDWGPYLGRADFYSLAYGSYVIGLNTNASKSYKLTVPKGGKAVKDLATGKTVKGTGAITVGPKSTVVLYVEP
ncbi:MAG TPA: hypothetical protein VGK19_04415 [Capsulimonadaceae bacterium]